MSTFIKDLLELPFLQNAVLAGLMYAKDHADVAISMDADLQDDIEAIEHMIDRYHDGLDVVYGVRSDRRRDTGFKRFTAELFKKNNLYCSGHFSLCFRWTRCS